MEDYASLNEQAEEQNLKYFTIGTLLSQVLGLGAVVLTAIWMSQYNGFAWTVDKVFNFHPLFMVIGFVFMYGDAILVYRVFRNNRKLTVKIMHVCMHVLALIFTVLGLKAAFDSHNLRNPPLPNLFSLHSWVGLTAVVLFALQWVMGFVSFFFPKLPDEARAIYLRLHTTWGVVIFVLGVAAALMGIQEKSGFGKYNQLAGREVLGNFVGLALLAFGVCVVLLVTKREFRRVEQYNEEQIGLTE